MGSVVKHVTSALTGHSGGGTQKTTESSNTNQQQQSWLQNNPQYQALETNALNEAKNFNMPQYQLAGMNEQEQAALSKLSAGVDTSQYKNASNLLLGQGTNAYNEGTNILSGAYSTLNQLGNMSQSDYQNMMKSEFNSDLVNEQINQMKGDINQNYALQVEGLNQQASGSGNMGNSRAGVTQGRFAEAAQKAIASGSVQYRTAEEGNAFNRLNSYLNQRISTANSLAGIGAGQQQMGLSAYGQGMNYYNQYNQAQTLNAQNQYAAGQAYQNFAQQQLDVNRQNQILSQSPALQRLAYYNQTYIPMANLQTTGNASGTGTSNTYAPGQGGNMLGGLMGMAGAAYSQSKGWSDTSTGLFSMGGSMFGNAFGG
ncbi:TPA: hypothetical protein QH056_001826 [Klebsiella oxytoca]|nr:hypothetical protein [Klebsiella oxytoca]